MLDKIILNVPKELISTVGSSTWINVIYVSIVSILLVWLVAILFKKFIGKDLLDICDFLGGKVLKTTIGILFILFIMLVLIFTLKNFSEELRLIYFRNTPYLYIILFFIVSSMIANSYSIKTLSKANLVIIPVVLLSIIVILASSAKDFVPQKIFPIMGFGVNETFFSGLKNLFSFSGLCYLFFLNPFLSDAKNFKKISIISMIISGVYLLLSVLCLLLSSSFTFNNNEIFSLYLLSRNLAYSGIFERIDAVFIFIWILATISYISIAMYFCIYLFKKITTINDTKTINYTFHLLILSVLILPTNSAIINTTILQFIRTSSLILIYVVRHSYINICQLKNKTN